MKWINGDEGKEAFFVLKLSLHQPEESDIAGISLPYVTPEG
jgi:hypothetical protein